MEALDVPVLHRVAWLDVHQPIFQSSDQTTMHAIRPLARPSLLVGAPQSRLGRAIAQ